MNDSTIRNCSVCGVEIRLGQMGYVEDSQESFKCHNCYFSSKNHEHMKSSNEYDDDIYDYDPKIFSEEEMKVLQDKFKNFKRIEKQKDKIFSAVRRNLNGATKDTCNICGFMRTIDPYCILFRKDLEKNKYEILMRSEECKNCFNEED